MRTIYSFVLIVVLTTGCVPLENSSTFKSMGTTFPAMPAIQGPKILEIPGIEHLSKSSGKLLEGSWSYECDVLQFNRYTWTSKLVFKHSEMVVEISFDDFDIQFGGTSLAFIIRSDEEEYRYDWLYVRTDGTFDPDLAYFKKYGLMEVYPGGYESFEQELIDMNIDWVTLYQKVRVEFYMMYLSNEYHCPVKPESPNLIA